MIIYKCDLCGKEVQPPEEYLFIEIRKNGEGRSLGACSSCHEKLWQMVLETLEKMKEQRI